MSTVIRFSHVRPGRSIVVKASCQISKRSMTRLKGFLPQDLEGVSSQYGKRDLYK